MAMNISEISSSNVIIEELTDNDISYHVQILTKSSQIFKTDTVNCEIDDYMKDLTREEIKEVLTATLCYVLNNNEDEDLNRIKINSLAFAVYLVSGTVGLQFACDLKI